MWQGGSVGSTSNAHLSLWAWLSCLSPAWQVNRQHPISFSHESGVAKYLPMAYGMS